MRCPICNKVNDSETKICVNCGQNIHENVAKEQASDDQVVARKSIIKAKLLGILKSTWFFVKGNWILVLIAIFSYQAMVNSEDARRYASNAEDYSADASDYARIASQYAEDAAEYAEDAANYAEEAADDTSYIRRWSF